MNNIDLLQQAPVRRRLVPVFGNDIQSEEPGMGSNKVAGAAASRLVQSMDEINGMRLVWGWPYSMDAS